MCIQRICIWSHFQENGHKHIGVTTLAFVGHVTSSVTYPLDLPYGTVARITYTALVETLNHAQSVIQSAICHFLLVSHWNRVSIFNHFREICIQIYLGHDLDFSRSRNDTGHLDIPNAISNTCSVLTKSVSPAIFEITGHKDIGVTILTFLDHVMSSVTWPIDQPYAISYWCPIGTECLSLTIFEIFASIYIWVTILSLQGRMTSSLTWPFDTPGVMSYKCAIVTNDSSHFRDNWAHTYWGHDLDLSRSPDVIVR